MSTTASHKSLKTVNQSLKHKVNRCVLSVRLNECKLSASRAAACRLFHTTGPATEKALSKFRSCPWYSVVATTIWQYERRYCTCLYRDYRPIENALGVVKIYGKI